MYEFITNRGDILNDLKELIRCFIPDNCACAIKINLTYVKTDKITVYVYIGGKKYSFKYPVKLFEDKAEHIRYELYVNKHALYKALSAYLQKELPWGSLTGVRPVKLAARLLQRGVLPQNIASALQSEYCVSADRAALTAEIIATQTKHMQDRLSVCGNISNLVNLYVHIPFCPTRCSYCSFVSQGIEKQKWLLLPYAEALVNEINLTKEILQKQNKRIFSVYIGGGTPTVLDCGLLEKVLKAAYAENTEFTCEAGRPDTIDEEKLKVMSGCGVNRISINPQTLHDKTLKKIGRSHTSEQFFKAYETAEKYGMCKNVDIIAGLTDETDQDFQYTLDNIVALRPENITVHTLCIKRGSQNALSKCETNSSTEKMVNYSIEKLKFEKYLPYYLYRQKQMSDNLENIGWCKQGFICVNNVTVMEEVLPVYACGAGAISKSILADGTIERLANPKDVILYLNQFDERMNKKQLFYKNQFTSVI